METTLIVGAFVVVGITAVAISTFSDKIKNALNFETPNNTDLPPGLANRMYDGYEDEDRTSVDRGGRRSRKKSKKK